MKADGPLCVRDGCLEKKSNDGHECTPLPAWEQSYLREAVFGSSPQVNFAAASYGEHDEAAKQWNWPDISSSGGSSRAMTPATPIASSASSVHRSTRRTMTEVMPGAREIAKKRKQNDDMITGVKKRLEPRMLDMCRWNLRPEARRLLPEARRLLPKTSWSQRGWNCVVRCHDWDTGNTQ